MKCYRRRKTQQTKKAGSGGKRMIKTPLRLGGSPVNNMKGLKRYLDEEGRMNFPELYKQWDRLIQFFDQDGKNMGAETLPPILKCRYQYLGHILRTDPETFEDTELTDDIFAENNQSGYEAEDPKNLRNLFSEIKKYGMIQVSLKETDPGYPYWICARNKNAVFSAVKKSRIAESKKMWVFYVLTALYSRIGILYEDYPPDMQTLELFFNGDNGTAHFAEHIRETISCNAEDIEIVPLGNGQNFVLSASESREAYEKGGITCKRLYRKAARTAEPVTVCFCEDGDTKKELGRIILREGESRNILVNSEGVILRVLPCMSTNKGDLIIGSLKEEMNLKLYHGYKGENLPERRPDREWSQDQCRGITSFAADGKGGFLAVCNGKILEEYVMEDMIYYDPQLEYAVDCGMEVAEVWIENGWYYFLKKDGSVFGSGPESGGYGSGRHVLDNEESGGGF